MSAAVFEFRLPRAQIISANDRLHHMVRASRSSAIRQRGLIAGRNSNVKLSPPVTLHSHIGWPDKRRRDRSNMAPTIKAYLDGVVSAGVLPDDSDAEIVAETYTSHVAGVRGLTVFEITLKEVEV